VSAIPDAAQRGASTCGDDAQWHVAGCLIHTRPADTATIRCWLEALPDVQVHGEANGKLVVTIEGSDAPTVLAQLDAVKRRAGVLSAVLVYQHCEALSQIEPEDAA